MTLSLSRECYYTIAFDIVSFVITTPVSNNEHLFFFKKNNCANRWLGRTSLYSTPSWIVWDRNINVIIVPSILAFAFLGPSYLSLLTETC